MRRGADTPMFRQYWRIKRRYPDAILLFRVGDFYETFFDDAKRVSEELGIALTSRQGAPLAGFPHHAAGPYIKRLVDAGFKVAICEQMEDPSKARGLVRREVVRVITPGTIVEEELLQPGKESILCAATFRGGRLGMAFFDASTGDLDLLEVRAEEEEAKSALLRYSPSEILVTPEAEGLVRSSMLGELESPIEVRDAPPQPPLAFRDLTGMDPSDLGIDDMPAAVEAAAIALDYVRSVNISIVVQRIRVVRGKYMVLDGTTLKNLEIFRNLRGGREGSLISVIDRTVTPMGSRTLASHLRMPLMDVDEINRRLDAVQELYEKPHLRDSIVRALRRIRDIERTAQRARYGRVSHQSLLALRESLAAVEELRGILEKAESQLLLDLSRKIPDLSGLVELLERSLEDDPDLVASGRRIKRGFSEELDELREAKERGARWLAELERRERARTGIGSLRIGYNKVLGYYIEIPKRYAYRVPRNYERKQGLKDVERYSSPELRRIEYKIVDAEERLSRLEDEIFSSVVKAVAEAAPRIKEAASAIGLVDVLASHAEVATLYDYTRPEVHDGLEIEIVGGRHPVLERVLDEPFIPNDLRMDGEENMMIILTGPNMAGKSTFMRQNALIILLAQIGSFVPAERARIGVVDRIFTRVGATDDLWKGRSTFMVEMLELSTILRSATRRSFVLLDEIGRGTSTFDGMSIAWAAVEYIHSNIRCRTIFATHYHQLTELERLLPGVRNYHVEVGRDGGRLLFLRKVLPGPMSESFGIDIAAMAGIPPDVVARAREILEELEGEKVEAPRTRGPDPLAVLREVDVDRISPIEALNLLHRLKRLAQGEEPDG